VPAALEMQQLASDAGVTYVGVYDVLPRSVLNFWISARPKGAHAGIKPIFTDQLARR
jgi:hypothetical protein